MPRYAITERAGHFVAGIRNAGVGSVLELTERQAEHELRLGTLTALDVASPTAADVPGDRKARPKRQAPDSDAQPQ